MARVYLSLGSNINRESNIVSGLQSVAATFGEMIVSSIFESAAVGFDGDNFYNLVAKIETDRPINELSLILRDIENDHGRDRNSPKFSARTLDIDILTYDDTVGDVCGIQLPRDEILKHAFVLWPLAEIAPEEIHPEKNTSYRQLWKEFDLTGQEIWVVTTIGQSK